MKPIGPSIIILGVLLLFGCATMQPMPPQELILTVKATEPTEIVVADSNAVQMHMEIENQEGELSALSFICQDRVGMKLFAGLTVGDVTNMWNDFYILEYKTSIRAVDLFISSPGGGAFSGLALADQIEYDEKAVKKILLKGDGLGMLKIVRDKLDKME